MSAVIFGDPWHGLYRGGVLELPNATTRTMLGTEPTGGSNRKVAIPGIAAPTTSPTETALGMTWNNYAVITGDLNRLYGKNLGDNAWLYVDDSLVPWLASWTFSAGTLTVTLKRFGLMDGAPESYVYTIALDVPASNDPKIDDVDSTGRNAAFVAQRIYAFEIDGLQWRVLSRIWVLTLAGTGDACTLSLDLKDSGNVLSETVSNTSTPISWLRDRSSLAITGPFDGVYVNQPDYEAAVSTKSGVYSYSAERAVGATFHGDVFRLVKAVVNLTNTITYTHDETSLFNGSLTELQPITGRPYWLVVATNTTVCNGTYGLSVDGHLTNWTMTQTTQVHEPDMALTVIEDLKVDGVVVGTSDYGGFNGNAWPFIGQRRIIEQRLGNRAYGAMAYSYDLLTENHVHFGAAGPVSGTSDIFLTSNNNPTFATAHHTTGELVSDHSGEVCFV